MRPHSPRFRHVAARTRAGLAQATVLVMIGIGITQAAEESDFYKIITLPTPEEVTLEVGAIQVLPGDRVAISTRFGDIFIVDKADRFPEEQPVYHHFASGLHEVLGLAWKDGWLYCTQRGEVTRMKDLDNDDRADVFETVCDGWGMTGDYHEYAFGSKFDPAGNLWVVLCLTGSFTSEAPWRGWCVRVAPDGTMVPTCSGIRSPGGIGTNSLGDMFYTDNQGVWNGTSGLKHLLPGHFVGNPTGNRWYSLTDVMGPQPKDPVSGSRMTVEADRIPELVPTAVYFPYNKMGQSASGIATDATHGRFGPFANQMFVGDQTHSTVMRVSLEKVQGRYQGALFPFRSGYKSGTLALEFAPDGSLYVGSTERGWGARGGRPFALERTVWTGKIPFEVQDMQLKPDGFLLTFTQPIDPSSAGRTDAYRLQTYTYIYQSSYGSPEVDQTEPTIQSVKVSEDRKSAHLVVQGLQRGHVHELHMDGVRSAQNEPLLHAQAYYTLNYFQASN